LYTATSERHLTAPGELVESGGEIPAGALTRFMHVVRASTPRSKGHADVLKPVLNKLRVSCPARYPHELHLSCSGDAVASVITLHCVMTSLVLGINEREYAATDR
jgi:hypothetical protein